MAFSGAVKLISQLTEATSVSDTDNLIIGGSDANKITWENLSKAIFLAAHPVGSVYISTSSTNPGTLYGGTWTSWGSGRVPVGVDSSDSDFRTVENTGGSKTHYHRLPIAINTNIDNWRYMQWNNSFGYGHDSITSSNYKEVGGDSVASSMSLYQLRSQTTSNVQPYITCYMWKRTA